MVYNLRDLCLVDTATEAQSAIEQATQNNYAAILMDINLGARMNGMKCAQEIRRIPGNENIPIAAVTANAMKRSKRRNSLKTGAAITLQNLLVLRNFRICNEYDCPIDSFKTDSQ